MVMETTGSPGPFRNTQMSKASHTHRLKKLRAPSKCRECDGLVVFHGAECEECSLACHKRCLETLAIQCGHRKLQGRLHLFGVEFSLAAGNSADGIPFIIRKCTSEIESRALTVKGIYRVNGARSRVEKLCQAFENGKDLVELSDFSAHDISNVLKLYLRQLPEPLILYRYYNDVIGLANESQRLLVEEESLMGRAAQPCLSVHLNRVIFKIRDLLRQLPPAHYNTLRFLTAHLHRVAEYAEENKMTCSNLGIIFGPTLIKPRQTEAEVSLFSLVDYPYQALMVELLVRHFFMVFDLPPRPVCPDQASPRPTPQERVSRNARPLMNIKERNLRGNNRHSAALADQEEDRRVTTPAVEVRLNGLPSTPAEVYRSTLVFGRPRLSATPHVQLRPVSMPLTLRVSGGQNQSAVSPETTEDTPPSGVGARRSPCIDTHSLRKTWDQQYNISPRIASDQERTSIAREKTLFPCLSHIEPWSRQRSGRGDGSGLVPPGEASSTCLTFRAPRILQPPPGTFYKPPHSARASSLGTPGPVTPPDTKASREEQSSRPQELSSIEIRPSFQRLRTHRVPELEHRETHFV